MKTTKLEFMVDDTNRIDIDLWNGGGNDMMNLRMYNKGADGMWHVRAGVMLTDDRLTALIRTLKEKQKELRG